MSSPKFIRLLVGGVPTLINVTDVTTVKATVASGTAAGVVTITYASGGTTILSTTASNTANFLAAAIPTVVQSFWNLIAESVAQPWNQPIIPLNGRTAPLMSPAVPQAQGATFKAKQSAPVLNQGGTPLVFLTAV